jgi:hypothetical protein
VLAITLWPFVFIDSDEQDSHHVLSNHERIHIAQATELFVIPFYLLWLFDWLYQGCLFGSFEKGYYHCRLEQEAYDHERELDYLSNRRPYAWWPYPQTEVAERWAGEGHVWNSI